MKKFVLVGTQRSGTTFIRHCLNSHDDIVCHGELFFRNYPDDAGYFKYIKRISMGKVRHLLFRSSVVKQYLDEFYSQASYEAIGYKLMFSQVRWLPYSFPSVLKYLSDNSISVIHVTRENVLKTYLSREVARKRKIYHAKSQKKIEMITLDVNNLLDELDKIRSENTWWKELFVKSDYHALSYESFVENKESESKRLLDFLGIDKYQDLMSSNVKITSDNLSEVIDNIDEVVACLQGTEFAYCVDGQQ